MKKEVYNEVLNILENNLLISRDVITKSSNLYTDLSADSLNITEIILEVEKYFDIEISDEDFNKITLVSDIVDIVEASEVDFF